MILSEILTDVDVSLVSRQHTEADSGVAGYVQGPFHECSHRSSFALGLGGVRSIKFDRTAIPTCTDPSPKVPALGECDPSFTNLSHCEAHGHFWRKSAVFAIKVGGYKSNQR